VMRFVVKLIELVVYLLTNKLCQKFI